MDVRGRIVQAALELLAEGGELTQPRVSRAAGVRQSHLTYYFPTVTDLLQAVARHSFDRLAGELGAAGRRRPPSVAAGMARASADKRRVRMMLGLVTAADRDASLKPRMRAPSSGSCAGASRRCSRRRDSRSATRTWRSCTRS